MKYKVIKEIEKDPKLDDFINSSAQCMLKLLFNRLFIDEYPDSIEYEKYDINFDYSMYGKDLIRMKNEMGYTDDKLKNCAESFVRKL